MEISLENVSFRYDGGRLLIEDFSDRFQSGEIVGIVGSSGCGKSTLLKIISLLLRPIRGVIRVDGDDFWSLGNREMNSLRGKTGFDFQDAALISNMSVERNLQLPVEYSMGDKSAAAKFAADAIVRGGLGEYSMMIPAALSYGIKRRVSLLRAEICAKGAFFCDEPNQVSDGRYKKLFSEILRKKRDAGALCLIASGDLTFLEPLVDRVVEIKP
ncbi:MAG TPA: ATP-binding cassette domain-containing protein [bacterium]|nr:ATP-binding cassette domain-containing protein [bacterium]